MPPIATAIAEVVAIALEYSMVAYEIVYAVSMAVIYAAVSYGLGAAIQAMTGVPSAARDIKDRMLLVRASQSTRRMVYGRVRTSGTLVFCSSTNTVVVPSGQPATNNGYLHMVIALAGHACDAIEEIYLGNIPLCDPALFDSSAQWVSTTNYSTNAIVCDYPPGGVNVTKIYQRTSVIFTPYTGVPYTPLIDNACW